MSKFISVLVAAMFAVASVSSFAASHAGGAMKKDGDKKEAKKGGDKKGGKMEKKGKDKK